MLITITIEAVKLKILLHVKRFIMSKIKTYYGNTVSPDLNQQAVFVRLDPYIYSQRPKTYVCCASRGRALHQKQYIDASNDEKYGEVKELGTIADYKTVSLKKKKKKNIEPQYMMDIRKKLMAGEKITM